MAEVRWIGVQSWTACLRELKLHTTEGSGIEGCTRPVVIDICLSLLLRHQITSHSRSWALSPQQGEPRLFDCARPTLGACSAPVLAGHLLGTQGSAR